MAVYSSVPFRCHFPSKDCFANSFCDFIEQYGKRIALESTTSSVSFVEISQKVELVSKAISKRIQKNDVIAMICSNSIEFLIFCLAATRSEVIIAPLNPSNRPYEIEQYCMKCAASVIVYDKMTDYLSVALDGLQALNSFNLFDFFENAESGESEDFGAGNTDFSNNIAYVFFSSGTTGPPKAIAHTNRSLVANLDIVLSAVDEGRTFPIINGNDIVYGVLPYFHLGGLMTVFFMLLQGAKVIINEQWDPLNYLQILQNKQVTVSNIVPPVLDFLSLSDDFDHFDLSKLRKIFVGAARSRSDSIASVKERLPNAEIIQLYGMTEAGVTLLMTPSRNTVADSVGVCMPGVQIQIVEGQLMVKAPTLMNSYLGLEEVEQDNWYETGDLGTIDENGNVFIIGRKKEVFKVRGWQVNPCELEEAILAKVKGVFDCAVIGIPDEQAGHRAKALFTGNAHPDDLIHFVNENFVSYKHLIACEMVQAIPRNTSGKIERHRLEN